MSSGWEGVQSRRKNVLVAGILFLLISGTLSLSTTYRITLSRLHSGFPVISIEITLLAALGLLLICAGVVGLARPAWTKRVGVVTLGYVVVYSVVSALVLDSFLPGLLYAAGGASVAGSTSSGLSPNPASDWRAQTKRWTDLPAITRK